VSQRDDFQVQRSAWPDYKVKRAEERDDEGRHEWRLSENARKLNRCNTYGVLGSHSCGLTMTVVIMPAARLDLSPTRHQRHHDPANKHGGSDHRRQRDAFAFANLHFERARVHDRVPISPEDPAPQQDDHANGNQREPNDSSYRHTAFACNDRTSPKTGPLSRGTR
jgi:hypothetical protein